MPRAGFELTTPVFEQVKNVHGLDRAATAVTILTIQSLVPKERSAVDTVLTWIERHSEFLWQITAMFPLLLNVWSSIFRDFTVDRSPFVQSDDVALNGYLFFFFFLCLDRRVANLYKRKQVNGKGFQNDGMSCCRSNETRSRDESLKRTESELH
jgi:hypothetical protein